VPAIAGVRFVFEHIPTYRSFVYTHHRTTSSLFVPHPDPEHSHFRMAYDLEPPLPRTATPKDYHRVHFDPSALPDKRIVGLLACQRESGGSRLYASA